jgi:hypothetical protein
MYLLSIIMSLWTSVAVNQIAGEQSYKVWGADLLPGADTVVITAPPGFHISLTSGAHYKSVIKVPYSNGKLDTIQIFAIFFPTAEKIYIDSISNIGGGAAAYVRVNGTGINQVKSAQVSSISNKIKYTIHKQNEITLKVFSYDGQLLQTPVHETQDPGTYTIDVQLPKGIYYYTLNVGNAPIIDKALVIQ